MPPAHLSLTAESLDLAALFERRCTERPDELAYAFVRDSLTIDEEVTYGQLRSQVQSLAAQIATRTAHGDRVLLAYPPGLEFVRAFWACTLSGRIAVPVPAPDPMRFKNSAPRLQAIIDDAQASLVLSTGELLDLAQSLGGAPWHATDTDPPSAPSAGMPPSLRAHEIAYLQYTSGSTATPRGVILTHANVVAQCRDAVGALGIVAGSRSLCWLPHYHDYGLVSGILWPLFAGAPGYLMSPLSFLRRPLRWLEAIERYGITHTGAPNFAYAACVRALDAASGWRGRLDSLVSASCGAEPIQHEIAYRFDTAFRPHGLRPTAFAPGYGMAECVLTVSASSPDDRLRIETLDAEALAAGQVRACTAEGRPRRHVVACGRPVGQTRVHVVDPHTLQHCSAGQVGEIWVHSDSVGRGYWRRPDETAATFGAFTREGTGPCLRTGDLGFVLDDRLFITGRLKDLIIVRGRNHYPQDLEWTAQRTHSLLRQGYGAAFSIDTEAGESVVLVQELERRADPEDLPAVARAIRAAVAEEHELAVHAVVFVRSGSVPRTSSGKIQRSLCKRRYLEGALDALHLDLQPMADETSAACDHLDLGDFRAQLARTPQREQAWLSILPRLVARLLRQPAERVALDASVFALGLDSLSVVRLTHDIETVLGRELSVGPVLAVPDLRTLAAHLAAFAPAQPQQGGLEAPPMDPSRLPLSATQEGVWLVERLVGPSAMYHLPLAVRFEGALDAALLHRCLQAVVDRHEALRTSVGDHDGTPVQTVHRDVMLTMPVTVLDAGEDQSKHDALVTRQLEEAASRPFDLSRPPLLRAELLRLSPTRHVLLLVVHHLVADGWSMSVIAREVRELYECMRNGATPPPLPVTPYRRFVQWQRAQLEGGQLQADLDYWKHALSGLQPLELPTDRPRPAQADHTGALVRLTVPAALSGALRQFAQQEGATLFMVLLAAFKTLLMRYTGQQDVAVGSPSACRLRPEFQESVGFFSNTLVLRTDLGGDPSFAQLLARVRETASQAYAHQAVPSDRLVSALGLPRDPGRNALYQVAFALQSMPDTTIRLPGLQAQVLPLHTGTAKIDLWAAFTEVDGELHGEFEYRRDLFETSWIEQLARHFLTLLGGIAAQPHQRLSRLPLLDEDERHRILFDWNATERPYPLQLCAHQLFEQVAREQPGAPAVRFDGRTMSYEELHRLSNGWARRLIELGAARGTFVAVAMERSFELAVALLAVMKTGAAFVPMDPSYPVERLSFMLQDCGASMMLTQRMLEPRMRPLSTGTRVVAVDDWPADDHASCAPRSAAGPDDAAYVIYTSGSTGQPKGALLPHRGLTNHLLWLREALRLDAKDRVLQKTSISFDASVWEFFGPLVAGASIVMARPGEHLDGRALLRTAQKERVTVLQMVPSALRALLDEADFPGCRSLRYLVCGGEALDPDLARDVLQRLPGMVLGNFYGPSEASDDSTYFELREAPEGRVRVPIGRPIANVRCHVLDAFLEPVPVGVTGELYIGGAGLAHGYLGRPELTSQRFVPDPFRPGERLYRTGDLGRYRRDGTLEHLGRTDFQVKLRGFRIELGEVEAALQACRGVRQSAAVLRDGVPGTAELVAYVVAPGTEPAALRRQLQALLPQHMVPAAIVPLETLPLLPNGKLDRRALPAPDRRATGSPHVLPRGPVEQVVWDIWREVLKQPHFGVHDNFFELGGHSLQATQVMSRIREALQAELPLRVLFEGPTVADLARHIEQSGAQAPSLPAVHRTPRGGPLPVSFSQRRMWLVQQFAPSATAYNMPFTLRLHGRLDQQALERALDALVARHEAFRTTFGLVDGEPMQFIGPARRLRIEAFDCSDSPALDREARARAWLGERARVPFDLARGPLHRLFLVRLDDTDHVLMWLMHHAISDQWSGTVLLRELAALYRPGNEPPPPLPSLEVEYADYAAWQRGHFASQTLAPQLDYWRRQLADMEPLSLPTDRPRPQQPSLRGAHAIAGLPRPVLSALGSVSSRHGATPFMTLLACFQLLLARYCGQDDVAVGTPIANRTRFASEHLVGTLVNTLVMRTSVSGDPTFAELLKRVRATAVDAYTHQDLPFDYLVEALQGTRHGVQALDIGVLFNVLNAPVDDVRLEGIEHSPFEVDRGAAQFDLSLHIDTEVTHKAYLEYATDLFDADTAQRLLDNYLGLLEQVLADADLPVSRYRLAGHGDLELLQRWNDTAAPYPRDATIHDLVAQQVRGSPAASAVIQGARELTYGELDSQANRLARVLRERGARRGTLVGLCLERDTDMLVAQLAVLKSGAAYVPLDPSYPSERLAYMAADAQLALLVTSSRLAGQLHWPRDRSLLVDADQQTVSRSSDEPLPLDELASGPEDPAYVIYTSGTTGRPKGVVIPHRAAVNFLVSMAREPGLSRDDRLLAVTTLSFDIAVLELLLPLTVGAQILLATRDDTLDGKRLRTLIETRGATVMQATPSTWRLLIEAGWRGRRRFKALVGGEPLPPDLAAQLTERAGELWNMYGPTETTVWSTCMRVEAPERGISIGRPIANTAVWVLDEHLQPCPLGVAGEICIGGDGLALGYLNRPELTAERFLDVRLDQSADPIRLYRTGDRGRWRRDGLLEHLGRLDFQVKVRGHRIELGEVESCLTLHPHVSRAIVAVREDTPGDVRLVAYVVVAGAMPSVADLREHLRRTLPEYMLPQHYVELKEIPLLPNGKIDRRSLPAPSPSVPGEEEPHLRPSTRSEQLVAQIWAELLGTRAIGLTDNFFDLGGHSLSAVRAIAKIEERLGVRLAPQQLIFETLQQVAASVDESLPSPASGPIPAMEWQEHRPGTGRGYRREADSQDFPSCSEWSN
ncbi:MAG TPA: amino acid adenylation domain-containing protein [Burkholderiaceae bacterium]|nr:amino acid adenylation domain-containing protein [Burkholderiaceae bacterium]